LVLLLQCYVNDHSSIKCFIAFPGPKLHPKQRSKDTPTSKIP
jgi:hypothetical protein